MSICLPVHRARAHDCERAFKKETAKQTGVEKSGERDIDREKRMKL